MNSYVPLVVQLKDPGEQLGLIVEVDVEVDVVDVVEVEAVEIEVVEVEVDVVVEVDVDVRCILDDCNVTLVIMFPL